MPISTLVAATVPVALTAAELVYQARALKLAYQRTWRLEDLEAQIRCYLRAIDLLCEANEGDGPLCTSISAPPKNSVSGEPLAKEEDSRRSCAIGASRTTTERHPSYARSNRYTSVSHRI